MSRTTTYLVNMILKARTSRGYLKVCFSPVSVALLLNPSYQIWPPIAAVEVLAESSDSITDPEVFDVYRSILKHSDSVPGHVMSKLLDSILSGLQSHAEITIRDIDQEEQQVYMAHKGPMERFSFLLQWFVTAAEKVKVEEGDEAASVPPPKAKRGRGGKAATGRGTRAALGKKSDSWTWSDQIPNVLNAIGKILKKLQVPRIWTTSSSKDNFIKYVGSSGSSIVL